MSEQTGFQQRFADMLAGDDGAITDYMSDPGQLEHLKVYKNNVVTAWADTIVKNYPSVERLVGTEFMRGAAVTYVKATPARSPVLSTYGDSFPDFLESFKPAESLPYLSDVARLDRAWTEAFFAPNVQAFDQSDVAGLDQKTLGALEIALHPSVHLLASNWNAHEIWKANRHKLPVKLTLKEGPSAAAVWWSPDGMADRVLEPHEHQFLSHIQKGVPVREALEQAAPDRDTLHQFFFEALAGGMFAAPINK